jgi:2-polyprenyl-3-methyl-5-hydroxy-6-metoxy-1,4-benzoquinol methylase
LAVRDTTSRAELDTKESPLTIDWAERWRSIVVERAAAAKGHSDPKYWDRRAPTFARSTQARSDAFLEVVAPYLSPSKTLIDVGAGAGRHALPLAERLEWVTAVEPSEGMRAQIGHRDNMTVVASSWEDAAVAPADLVICSHVLYGVEDPVPFIEKLEASARERVFIMLRESPMAHLGAVVREQMLGEEPGLPRFSDLFMLLMQMGVAPDVTFTSYPNPQRYANIDEALADCQAMIGDRWEAQSGRAIVESLLDADGHELLFQGDITLTGIAHWQPRSR